MPPAGRLPALSDVNGPRRVGGQQIIQRPEVWSPGPQAPWPVGASPSMDQLLAVVAGDEVPIIAPFPDARESAVLVVLTDGPDGPEVLLTRRSWEMRTHRGEVSFPGGGVDAGETMSEAALREAHEEVGLDPSVVTLHGELAHIHTWVSRSYIVPTVATVPERFELSAQTMEVDRVLWVPLREFTRADTYRSERWGDRPSDFVLHFFELDNETVWGATARILVDLLTRAIR